MSNNQKRYFYKVYNAQYFPLWDAAIWDVDIWDQGLPGAYITTWSTDVISEPNFTMVLNGGAGQLQVRLARPYNNFGEGVDVAFNNRVDLYVGDTDNVMPQLIYSGYISSYSPTIDGVTQYVDITILGFITETSSRYMKDATGNTAVAYLSEDPAAIMQDAIDKYRRDYGFINYTASSIQSIGSTVSYQFNLSTYKEVLDTIIKLCPDGWYWYVDATNVVNLKQANFTTADITLTVGKDNMKMQAVKRIEDVVNRVYVVGGNPVAATQLYKRYDRTSSISDLHIGLHEDVIQDGRVTIDGTADIMAKRELDQKQIAETRLLITVSDDNGQDGTIGSNIEKFVPGKTIQVKNLSYGGTAQTFWDVGVFDTSVWDFPLTYSQAAILLINRVNYYPTHVDIEASSRLPEVSKIITQVERSLDASLNDTLPIIPTTGSV